jgi:uncharacterized lipoprotein YajG
MLSFFLSGCAFTRDYVDIEYTPRSTPQRIVAAENVEVAVNVNDVRVKEYVGRKTNGYGMEAANIMINNDVADVFKNAIIWELEQRGFVIGDCGSNLNIEICKFFNDYKLGPMCSNANSETVLHVILRDKSGTIVYSKTIIGLGEEEACFLTGGKNASRALEGSLHNAIKKLMNDCNFISALLANS